LRIKLISKVIIGILATVVILNTAMLSFSAFTDFKSGNTDLSEVQFPAQAGNVEHSVDTNSSNSGLMAVPWVSANFIRQSVVLVLAPFRAERLTKIFTLTSYPGNRNQHITDRVVFMKSNTHESDQILLRLVAKLKAG